MITQAELDRQEPILGLPRGSSDMVRGNWYAVLADCYMTELVKWAKAYEAGQEIVSDVIYDGTVADLIKFRDEFPAHFDMLLEKHHLFRDGTWTMTGNFWRE